MSKFLVVLALSLGILPEGQAGEAWQPVFEDASVSVAVDSSSIRREGRLAVFRERMVLLKPELDQASMRPVKEVQHRRQIDCVGHVLSDLSRVVFSDQGALLHYEASRPSAVKWDAPKSDKDFKLIEVVCRSA